MAPHTPHARGARARPWRPSTRRPLTRPRAPPILARTREGPMAHLRVSRRRFLIGAGTAGAAVALGAGEGAAQKKGASLRLWILQTYGEPTKKAVEASARPWAAKHGRTGPAGLWTFRE